MSKLLLVGATGYLGKRILNHFLTEGYEVTIITNCLSNLKSINEFLGNVRNLNSDRDDFDDRLNEQRYDVFISAAVDYGKVTNSTNVINCNVILPLKIIESIKYKSSLLVITFDSFFSKNLFYQDIHQSKYTLSKKQLIEWLEFESKTTSLSSVILRLEHLVGPDESDLKFNGWLMNNLKSDITEIKLSEGNQIRDFVYVDDVIDAIQILVKNNFLFVGKNTIVEVGSGVGHTIKEFVQLLHFTCKSKAKLIFGALPYKDDDLMESVANNSVLISLGWKPITRLDEIVNKIIK